MRYLYVALACLFATTATAQQHNLYGMLADTSGKPVSNAAVSLLEPSDSTLAFFGISNSAGRFELASVRNGSYLLQVASMGHRIYYKPVRLPVAGNDLGYIMLRETSQLLGEIEVKSAKIPVLLRGDTVEYNAGAYKLKQDAVAEDLLRKLPGVQLDKAGNIKAQGKDVRKVLVDGKEFFGDDPKMATKNLPADAIDKVQVFGKKSDQAQFTGIDDGTRDQTINLQLKDDKRNGYFGDLEAGGGMDDHYKLSAKLYRFQPQRQFAALGMLNNINQFGFSFQDYLSFQGGLRGMTDGDGDGRIRIGANMPINFGQPVTGLITSGAAGVNYSADARAGQRFTISYLGNGADKKLSEQRISRNFTGASLFTTQEDLNLQSMDAAHRLNFSWRNDMDSSQQLLLRGGATATNNRGSRTLSSLSGQGGILRNSLNSIVRDNGDGVDGSLSASYLRRFRTSPWPVWKLFASGAITTAATATEWDNRSSFLKDTIVVIDRQYQDNNTRNVNWEAGTSIIRKLGPGYYLEPSIKAGADIDELERRQGVLSTNHQTDSLSLDFSRRWNWIRPGISLRHNTAKVQLSITLEAESDYQHSGEGAGYATSYRYLRPSAFYQNAYMQGAQINLSYASDISPASALQLLPVTNYLNPLQRIVGNPFLAPEYRHTLQAGWLRFDQFSFTSMMFNLRGSHTSNKISWSRQIGTDLGEDMRYINVPDDYLVAADAEYNTPLRKIGMKLTVALEERYNRGLSQVNNNINQNTTFNHNLRLSLSNQRREHWDIESGVEADVTDTRSSLDAAGRSMFYHYKGYAKVSYKPTAKLNISLHADIDRYVAPSFPEAVTIPLLSASASYYFLKYRRGVLTLEAFDLLNRNTSLRRISQLNYLLEERSNIIQQYFLLSFKYRLSKADNGKSAVDIDVKR